MSESPSRDRRPIVLDVASRVAGVAVFGSMGVAMALGMARRIGHLPEAGTDAAGMLDLVSKGADLLFLALLVVLFAVRRMPVRKQGGVVPRIAALAAALGLPYVLLLPRFDHPIATWIAAILGIAGNGFALVALAALGRSFSLFPEARRLVTTGPYRLVRHPLYLAEELAIVGMIANHLHPVSVAAGVVHLAIQLRRMRWEEQVLEATFPEYAAYRRRVRRFIPGVW